MGQGGFPAAVVVSRVLPPAVDYVKYTQTTARRGCKENKRAENYDESSDHRIVEVHRQALCRARASQQVMLEAGID
jgi:hypothetical protein